MTASHTELLSDESGISEKRDLFPDVSTTHYTDAAELIQARQERWVYGGVRREELRRDLLSVGLPLISNPVFAPLPTYIAGSKIGWTYATFIDYTTSEHHSALIYGDTKQGSLGNLKDVPVRIHSASKLGDVFFGRNGNQNETNKLSAAMELIAREKRGIILYTEDDGRGHGGVDKINSLNVRYGFNESGLIYAKSELGQNTPISVERSYRLMNLKPDGRDYATCVDFLRLLGVESVQLITEHPNKTQAINDFGLPARTYGQKTTAQHSARLEDSPKDERSTTEKERLKEFLLSHIHRTEEEAYKPWETIKANRDLLRADDQPVIERFGMAPAPTKYGDWTIVKYGDYTTGEVHIALVYGNLKQHPFEVNEDLIVRIHSSCRTNEIFHSTNCECQAELATTMGRIQDEGKGIILYLDQEGRGTGVFGKMRQLQQMFQFSGIDRVESIVDPVTGLEVETAEAYEKAALPPETRDFTVAAEILRDLGIKDQKLRLATNNPRKIDGLRAHGFKVQPEKILVDLALVPDPERIAKEWLNKADRLGHDIDLKEVRRMLLVKGLESRPEDEIGLEEFLGGRDGRVSLPTIETL